MHEQDTAPMFSKLQKMVLINGKTRAAHVADMLAWYTQPAVPHNTAGRRVYLNLPYAVASERQKLDIYTPAEGTGFPVLFWIHGGAWYTGDRADFGVEQVLAFVERGYAVVSAGYRLTDEAIYPAQLEDLQTALDYIQANGGVYGLDTECMGLCSGSAGSTLAAILGLQSGAFRSVHLRCAILDFGRITAQFTDIGFTRGRFAPPELDTSIEALLLGGSIMEQPQRCHALTPIHYARSDAPHFLLLHGKVDVDTPYLQSVEFAEALNRITGDESRAQVVLFETTGHDGGEFETTETFERCLCFFEKHLRQKSNGANSSACYP